MEKKINRVYLWKNYPHIEKVADGELTRVLLFNGRSMESRKEMHEYFQWVNDTLGEADDAIISELGLDTYDGK